MFLLTGEDTDNADNNDTKGDDNDNADASVITIPRLFLTHIIQNSCSKLILLKRKGIMNEAFASLGEVTKSNQFLTDKLIVLSPCITCNGPQT